ncbi:hypothetical protein [Herbaspirillum huttiense]|uniref:hypothetical protein n=1 Tax=Herbaspirillum huttiense TaxID=863372 RepID=UPI0039AF2961
MPPASSVNRAAFLFHRALRQNDGAFRQKRLWIIEKCRLRRHMKEKTTRPLACPFFPSKALA